MTEPKRKKTVQDLQRAIDLMRAKIELEKVKSEWNRAKKQRRR